MKAFLSTAALATLLGGCATTIETGPGYYRYNTQAAGAPPAISQEPAVAVPAPTVVYQTPPVADENPPVINAEPAFDSRIGRGTAFDHDHAQ
jgi:hypothetical protein